MRLLTNKLYIYTMKLFKVNMMKMNIKYWKPENEFHLFPSLEGRRGGFIKKDIHFSGFQYFILHLFY